MKKYYVINSNFVNAYRVVYTETNADIAELPESAERITRKEAEFLVRQARQWKREDGYTYASTEIKRAGTY